MVRFHSWFLVNGSKLRICCQISIPQPRNNDRLKGHRQVNCHDRYRVYIISKAAALRTQFISAFFQLVQWQSQSFSTAKLSGGVEITIQFNRMFQHLWFQAVQHWDSDLLLQVSCIAVAIVVAQVVWFIFFGHWMYQLKTILINSLQFR